MASSKKSTTKDERIEQQQWVVHFPSSHSEKSDRPPPMATNLLRLSLLPHKNLCFSYSVDSNVCRFDYNSLVTVKQHRNLLLPKRRRHLLQPHLAPNLVLSNSLETKRLTQNDAFRDCDESSALLDVSGMMCGGCVS